MVDRLISLVAIIFFINAGLSWFHLSATYVIKQNKTDNKQGKCNTSIIQASSRDENVCKQDSMSFYRYHKTKQYY